MALWLSVPLNDLDGLRGACACRISSALVPRKAALPACRNCWNNTLGFICRLARRCTTSAFMRSSPPVGTQLTSERHGGVSGLATSRPTTYSTPRLLNAFDTCCRRPSWSFCCEIRWNGPSRRCFMLDAMGSKRWTWSMP